MTISTEQFITVNVGSVANDGTGDSLREAFIKLNDNFANISDIGFDAGNIDVRGAIESQGNITAPYFIGDGGLLSNITVSTAVSATSANTAVTVTGNAQANVTSVGTLTDLTVSGNINCQTVLIHGGAILDQSITYHVPTEGSTVNVAINSSTVILNPATNLTAVSINMPSLLVNGQLIRFACNANIATATITGTGGANVSYPSFAVTRGLGFSFIYRETDTTWYRLS